MDEKQKKFFKNNEIRIGKDYTITPPVHYSSLANGFYNYFLTFRDKKDSYHFLMDKTLWTRESMSMNFSGEESNKVFAILGFHRFLELLLKDVLRRINPLLAVKFLEKPEEIFKHLDQKLNPDDVNTIEFREAHNRFKQAFRYYNKTSEEYLNVLKNYDFLNEQESIDTMEMITSWRNRIIHNGSTLPNLFAFEYLISQRFIPLINQILIAEKEHIKDFKFHFIETKTGIKVLDEIMKIKFTISDFDNTNDRYELAFKIIKLGHLKEIGRAAYNNDRIIRHNKSYYEPYYENPIGRHEQFAASEANNPEFYSLNNCICCGAKTLVVYRKELDKEMVKLFGSENYISWMRCYNECGYSVKNTVGDPFQFGLSEHPLFPTE